MLYTKLWPFFLILIIFIFYLFTIRAGQDWGDDFAMYIHHARNIVQGRDYAATGYIYNPFASGVGPRTYPPIFPLLLAPVYAGWGLDLTPMKIEVVGFFVGSLVLLVLYYRKSLPPAYLLCYTALVGLNPLYWQAKDKVLSDIPFLFFVCLGLWLVRIARRTQNNLISGLSGLTLFWLMALGRSVSCYLSHW